MIYYVPVRRTSRFVMASCKEGAVAHASSSDRHDHEARHPRTLLRQLRQRRRQLNHLTSVTEGSDLIDQTTAFATQATMARQVPLLTELRNGVDLDVIFGLLEGWPISERIIWQLILIWELIDLGREDAAARALCRMALADLPRLTATHATLAALLLPAAFRIDAETSLLIAMKVCKDQMSLLVEALLIASFGLTHLPITRPIRASRDWLVLPFGLDASLATPSIDLATIYRVASHIPVADRRSGVVPLARIAASFGSFDVMHQAMQLIESPSDIPEVLALCASDLARQGNQGAARFLLTDATRRLARLHTRDSQQTRFLANWSITQGWAEETIAMTLVILGEEDTAVRTAARLSNTYQRDRVLQAIGRACAEREDWQAALATLGLMTNPLRQAATLLELSEPLVNGATATTAAIRQTVRASIVALASGIATGDLVVKEPLSDAVVSYDVRKVLAGLVAWDEIDLAQRLLARSAMELVAHGPRGPRGGRGAGTAKFPSPRLDPHDVSFERATIDLAMARHAVRKGDGTSAKQILAQLTESIDGDEDSWQGELLSSVAVEQANAGLLEASKVTFDRSINVAWQWYQRKEWMVTTEEVVAEALGARVRAGQVDEALAETERLRSPKRRAAILSALIHDLIDSGHADRAAALLPTLPSGADRRRVAICMGSHMARTSSPDQVRDAISSGLTLDTGPDTERLMSIGIAVLRNAASAPADPAIVEMLERIEMEVLSGDDITPWNWRLAQVSQAWLTIGRQDRISHLIEAITDVPTREWLSREYADSQESSSENIDAIADAPGRATTIEGKRDEDAKRRQREEQEAWHATLTSRALSETVTAITAGDLSGWQQGPRDVYGRDNSKWIVDLAAALVAAGWRTTPGTVLRTLFHHVLGQEQRETSGDKLALLVRTQFQMGLLDDVRSTLLALIESVREAESGFYDPESGDMGARRAFQLAVDAGQSDLAIGLVRGAFGTIPLNPVDCARSLRHNAVDTAPVIDLACLTVEDAISLSIPEDVASPLPSAKLAQLMLDAWEQPPR